jgi:hypothetical protein
MKSSLISFFLLSPLFLLFIFSAPFVFAGPQSTNYEIKEYGFGSGGTSGSDSTNYTIFGTSGETDASQVQSANFKTNGGLVFTMQANIPPAPTFTNPSNYYNKLHLVLSTGNNPSDTTYAIAISADNFSSDTRYVQSDNTIGATLGSEDWQTYTTWGGASGFDIIGLQPDTTYTVKVTAEQGNFTQSSWSATSQVATANVTLSFDIDTSSTDTETSAPYTVSMGNLTSGSVTTAPDYIWLDLSTNAEYGGHIYLYDSYTGLRSSSLNYTISSSSTNLAAAQEGYGIKVNTTSNLTAQSPYNGASDNVGVVDTTIREVFNSGNAPVSNGRGSLAVKAKISSTTPASNDYEDTITLVASGAF